MGGELKETRGELNKTICRSRARAPKRGVAVRVRPAVPFPASSWMICVKDVTSSAPATNQNLGSRAQRRVARLLPSPIPCLLHYAVATFLQVVA
jgi:hypothetical protein